MPVTFPVLKHPLSLQVSQCLPWLQMSQKIAILFLMRAAMPSLRLQSKIWEILGTL